MRSTSQAARAIRVRYVRSALRRCAHAGNPSYQAVEEVGRGLAG
jgi:hypothetical protein